MVRLLALMIIPCLFIFSCDSLEKNDAEKLAMTAKMQEKVQKVSADLKAYCDSEMHRKARWKADSILSKRALFRLK